MGSTAPKRSALFTKDIEAEYDRFVMERRRREIRTRIASGNRKEQYFWIGRKPRTDRDYE